MQRGTSQGQIFVDCTILTYASFSLRCASCKNRIQLSSIFYSQLSNCSCRRPVVKALPSKSIQTASLIVKSKINAQDHKLVTQWLSFASYLEGLPWQSYTIKIFICLQTKKMCNPRQDRCPARSQCSSNFSRVGNSSQSSPRS